MKRSITFFLSFVIFWLLFFAMCRLVFLISAFPKWKMSGFREASRSFLFGMTMDLSTIAYLGTLPLLIWSVLFLLKKVPQQSSLFRFYIFFLIVIISVAAIVDFNIYREWGSKLNYRAFRVMLDSPHLAFASTLSSPLLLSFLTCSILIITGVFLYRWMYAPLIEVTYPKRLTRMVFVTVVLSGYIISIRGGLSTSPITISSVYYSGNQTLNHAAVNTEWNFFRDFLDQKNVSTNPYQFMPDSMALSICNRLLITRDSTVKFLDTSRPNIVLVILESFTADVIASLNGEKNVTPFLDSLIREGFLFSNIYASGFRTDIGFISIHTGFPSQAIRCILSFPEKAKRLPSISSSLSKNGYHTSFYYGGESEFFNFRSFILSKDYEMLVDRRDFERKDLNTKWGAHDDVVFKRVLKDLKTIPVPFFSTIMTLSNHEPFELPVPPQFPGKDLPNRFRSTAYYTDQSLKYFFNAASKEDWYQNTLFVLVADHGHRLPKQKSEIYHPRRSHIPLLFFGKVLKNEFKGKRMEKVGAQGDLPATLLAQLGIANKEFYWSKNLMNPLGAQFAFSTFDNGFTWIETNQAVSFDNNSKKIIFSTSPPGAEKQLLQKGNAFLQKVYYDFLSY